MSAEAPVIEAKQSEISTNVTEQQLNGVAAGRPQLPELRQPRAGVRTATDENNKEVLGGAIPGFNTNVFIDGTSYKNDVLNGGVVGQDSSRGNPFPQNAVQEFRVVTQNYKAEYEKASSAIITAVTKSGGNEFHGDGFAVYQDKGLVAVNQLRRAANRCAGQPKPGFVKPDYTRWQAGSRIGGPIIKDKLHFFGSWEIQRPEPQQQRFGRDRRSTSCPSPTRSQPARFSGQRPEPVQVEPGVRQDHLAGGPERRRRTSNGFYRHEDEVKDVGGTRAFEAGTDIINAVWNVQAKNAWLSSKYLNETILAYQDYKWNPSPVVAGIVGQDYQNALRIGSTDNLQNFHQKRFSLRDDFTVLDFRAAGDHVVKIGAVFSNNKYDVQKQFNGIPIYRFRSDIPAGSPVRVPVRGVRTASAIPTSRRATTSSASTCRTTGR